MGGGQDLGGEGWSRVSRGEWGGGGVGGLRLPRLRKIEGYKACAKFRGSAPAFINAEGAKMSVRGKQAEVV